MPDEIEHQIQRATRGDALAVGELLTALLPGLRAFVRARAGRLLEQESAGDLVQSTCRDILENLDRFEHGGAEGFRHWLYRTALRKIADRREFHGAQKRDVGRVAQDAPIDDDRLPGALPSPSQEALARERADQVEAALARLPVDHREVILLSRFARLSQKEIAQELGRSEDAVQSLLARALSGLAEQMERGARPQR